MITNLYDKTKYNVYIKRNYIDLFDIHRCYLLIKPNIKTDIKNSKKVSCVRLLL